MVFALFALVKSLYFWRKAKLSLLTLPHTQHPLEEKEKEIKENLKGNNPDTFRLFCLRNVIF